MFMAGIIGVLTGIYIYKPIFDQYRREQPELLHGEKKEESES